MTAEEHRASVLEWRQGRIDRLLADTGYLTLAGMFWLDEGTFILGSGKDADFQVREGTAPKQAARIHFVDGVVTIEPIGDTPLLAGDEPIVGKTTLASDAADEYTLVRLGDLSFYVIERAEKVGIRLRDPESPVRKNFTSIESWEIEQRFAVQARFEPYDPPRKIPIPNEVGVVQDWWTPGSVHFEWDGKQCSLDALQYTLEDDFLFLIFRDHTSGEETYGAGRFLYTDAPKDGKVIIDFNRAYNPPCAFSPYTTCPIPPLQNELDVAIRAGEKNYEGP